MRTIVLLTEDALTDHDAGRVAELHGEDRVAVHVLVPVDTAHNALVEAVDELALGRVRDALHDSGTRAPEQARGAAQTALDASLESLRLLGLDADGGLVPDDPVDAVSARVRELGADEVVVVTAPHLLETTFRRDWGSRLRAALPGTPVLHAVAGTDRVY